MNRPSEPMLVSPRPLAVPRFMVQNSRNTLRSPIVSVSGSPLFFLSVGAPPIAANGKIWLSSPMRVGPSMTACAPIVVRAPMITSGPITAKGPTVTPAPSCAREETTACESIMTRPSLGHLRCHHHVGAGHLVAADGGGARKAPDAFEAARQLHRKNQLIARLDRLAKARLVDTDEVELGV